MNPVKLVGAALDVFEKKPIDPKSIVSYKWAYRNDPTPCASNRRSTNKVAVDVAEQIRDVLSGKSARSAVNIPSLRADLLEPVKEYMNLAENIGLLTRQVSEGGVKKVEIVVRGVLAQLDVAPLKVAVLKGILSHNLEDINYVNAPIVAKQHGIDVKESKSDQCGNYSGHITVKLTTDTGNYKVSGAMLAKDTPRIVTINGNEVSLEIAEHMLIAPHKDKPGMIAKVSTIIGNNNINIRMMTVARKEQVVGGESIMIITTDEFIRDEILTESSKLTVLRRKYINLSPEKPVGAQQPSMV